MNLNPEQLEQFDVQARTAFHKRLSSFVRREIPESTASASEADLLKYIDARHVEANGLGIESEAGISQFVCLSLAAGPGFHETEAVRALFEVPGVSAEEKLSELTTLLQSGLQGGHASALDVLMRPDGMA